MMRPIEQFIFDSLVLNHDDYDGICYIKYLSECKTMSGETILWVGANTKEKEVVFFVTNDDDTCQRFEYISCIPNDLERCKVIHQINPLVRQIVYRTMQKKFHEDLPCNFFIKSISGYMQETDTSTNQTYSGEVGISGTDSPYMVSVSVFYPNKVAPSHSYDTELYLLSQDELRSVLACLSEDNNSFAPKELEVEQSTTFSIPLTYTQVLKGRSCADLRRKNFGDAKEKIMSFLNKHQMELAEMGIEYSPCDEHSIDNYFGGHEENILTEVNASDIEKFCEGLDDWE